MDKRRYEDSIYADSDNEQKNILVSIYDQAGKDIGQIRLDQDWRSANSDMLEFIVLARYCPYTDTDRVTDGYYVLLIERIGASLNQHIMKT